MGHVHVRTQIANVDGTRSTEVEAMVDTGATYTFLPWAMLRELGIAPTRTSEFQLASGETAQYARGQAVVRINGFAQMTPVVFGDDDAEPLIGVVTLEQLELAVDPVANALIPARPRL
jgi:aspartyl protease family protein